MLHGGVLFLNVCKYKKHEIVSRTKLWVDKYIKQDMNDQCFLSKQYFAVKIRLIADDNTAIIHVTAFCEWTKHEEHSFYTSGSFQARVITITTIITGSELCLSVGSRSPSSSELISIVNGFSICANKRNKLSK